LSEVGKFIHDKMGIQQGHPLLIVLVIDDTEYLIRQGEQFFMEFTDALYSGMTSGSPRMRSEW